MVFGIPSQHSIIPIFHHSNTPIFDYSILHYSINPISIPTATVAALRIVFTAVTNQVHPA